MIQGLLTANRKEGKISGPISNSAHFSMQSNPDNRKSHHRLYVGLMVNIFGGNDLFFIMVIVTCF